MADFFKFKKLLLSKTEFPYQARHHKCGLFVGYFYKNLNKIGNITFCA